MAYKKAKDRNASPGEICPINVPMLNMGQLLSKITSVIHKEWRHNAFKPLLYPMEVYCYLWVAQV